MNPDGIYGSKYDMIILTASQRGGPMIHLARAYGHWWRHRRRYRGVALWIAMLNAGAGVCLYLLGKGYEIRDPLAIAGALCGLFCLLGARAAVKIRLIYAIRKETDALPRNDADFGKVWLRYIYGYVLVALPVLIVPMVIWFEATLFILLLRWRMHFLPYTGVLEPERDIGRNGVRRGLGMVWPVCVTSVFTKWMIGLFFGIGAVSFWLAGDDALVLAALGGWALMSMVTEPLYQTGNLLMYERQYLAQSKFEPFWMDMEEYGIREG